MTAPKQGIDPTENVRELFNIDGRHRDALRASDNRYQDAMRDAETRRINELAAQKTTFDFEMARVLRSNMDAASNLLATQLKEVKNDLSDRTSKLEQFRWESGGKAGGRGDMIAWIVAGLMLLAAVASPIIAYVAIKPR